MTKASTEKYWERRHLQVKAKEIKNTEAYEKALQPELNGLYRELHSEMEKWYVKYANLREASTDEVEEWLQGVNTRNWGMSLERFEEYAKTGRNPGRLDREYYKSRVARLQDLEQQLRQVSQPYASRETGRMRDGLAKQFEDTYMRTNYTVQASKGAFTANFAHFNEAQLRMVVSNPWGKDGKDFSKRIWKNYQQALPEMLRDTVLKSTLMGYGPHKASQLFHAKFQDFKKSNVHRLVTSEMGHIAEEAAAKGYEENEIERYEYMATLESHTCDICGRLDGQKFKLSERKDGINYPLIHPYCRCTTVPYIDDLPDITERWSRDPNTGKGKMIKDVKFDEWKNMIERRNMVASGVTAVAALRETNMITMDGEDNFNKFATQLSKLEDPQLLRLLTDNGVDVTFSKLKNGTAFARGSSVQLSQECFDGNDYELPMQVVYHEIGHALDYLAMPKLTGGQSVGTGKTVRKTLAGRLVEIKETVTHASGLPKYGLNADIKSDFWHFINGDLKNPEELGPKPRGEVEKAKWQEEAYAISEQSGKNFDQFKEKYKKLAKANLKKYAALSDIIESTGYFGNEDYILGVGHGYKYWKTVGNAETEFIAHMTESIGANPEALEVLQEIFPNASKTYRTIIQDIIESEDV